MLQALFGNHPMAKEVPQVQATNTAAQVREMRTEKRQVRLSYLV